MNQRAFDLAAARTGLEAEARRAAFLVLVDGLRVRDVAIELSLHRQAVSRAVRKVREAALKEGACPTCGRTL
jgi:transposase